MTEGSLKLNETALISLSYTEMISTFPWHQSVTAFCQWTILSGSYDAFSSNVCSMRKIEPSGPIVRIVPDDCWGVKTPARPNRPVECRLHRCRGRLVLGPRSRR